MDRAQWVSLRDNLAESFATAAHVNLICDEATHEDNVENGGGVKTEKRFAIEMAPVARCLEAMPSPTAKWTVVVFAQRIGPQTKEEDVEQAQDEQKQLAEERLQEKTEAGDREEREQEGQRDGQREGNGRTEQNTEELKVKCRKVCVTSFRSCLTKP
jgi:hypothetical protein